MRRLVPGLVACLVALPLTVLAVVFATSPANRDDNGVGLTPAMGWSSWSFLRHGPLTDLWTHRRTQTTGTTSAEVPSHGVALFRMSPLRHPAAAPLAEISNPSLAGTLAGARSSP